MLASTASAVSPMHETSSVILGPFVDEELCAFPVTTVVERTRRITTFANGDVRRHTQLIVTTTANGKIVVDHASFNVFMPSGSTVWVITGVFVHARPMGGGTVALCRDACCTTCRPTR